MPIDITHQANCPVENSGARGIIGEISSDVLEFQDQLGSDHWLI